MKNINKENIKLLFNEGINFLQSQIELLAENNDNLKKYTYMQYIEKNTPLIASESISQILHKEEFTQKVKKLADIFTNIKEYMQSKEKEIKNNKLCGIKELQDIFKDYTNMLFNNLDNFDLHESFEGWTEDGTIYNTRADDNIISSHTAGVETLLLNHFSEDLDKFTWELADLLEEFLELTIEKIKLIYKYEENGNYYYEDENEKLYCENGNHNIGEVCLWHCTKDYGEPICEVENLDKYELVNNPKDDPNFEKKQANKFDYMMLGRLQSDCDYFLGCGNGSLNSLYYHNVDRHIEEMKKIYNSFSKEERPEWISLEEIDSYQEKMNKILEKDEEEI